MQTHQHLFAHMMVGGVPHIAVHPTDKASHASVGQKWAGQVRNMYRLLGCANRNCVLQTLKNN
jgi:hypothetical protein